MSMNIKNSETERLAREVASLNGETMTMAITVALRERLERLQAKRAQGLGAWLRELSRQTAPLMNDGKTSKELLDELYDEETGLPK